MEPIARIFFHQLLLVEINYWKREAVKLSIIY
jgi:hypothetical protein